MKAGYLPYVVSTSEELLVKLGIKVYIEIKSSKQKQKEQSNTENEPEEQTALLIEAANLA